MRLTLRNILAYLHDLLDTEAALLIAKKIEESEFASGLVHRVRDVMRRTRLGAPDVMDREGGLDPNTMAEYIDTTLPTARVGDFEKVCLESDVHLAEVASCHQVLALVLGEPAEVDPNTRERMYHLPNSVAASQEAPPVRFPEPPPVQHREVPADKVPADTVPHPPKIKPSVPEYLRASRRKRRLRPVAAIAVILLLGVLLLTATGQFRPGSFVGRMLGLASTEDQADRSLAISGEAEPTDSRAELDPSDAETTEIDQPKPSETVQTAPLPPDLSTSIVPSTDSTPKAPGGSTAVGQDPPSPQPTDVASVEPKPRSPDRSLNVDMPAPSVDATTVKPPRAPSPPVDMGHAAGEFLDLDPAQVLLRFQPPGGWQRLAAKTGLAFGDRLLSFPTFRPTISLGQLVEITLVDGTGVQLPPAAGDPSTVGVSVEYGRAIIKCTADGGCGLRLYAGDVPGIVTFAGAQSQLAVEVARKPGSTADPETQPAAFEVTLYATGGECSWQAASGGEPVDLVPPARLVLTGQAGDIVPDVGGATWVAFDTTDPLMKLKASPKIEHGLTEGSSVLLRLAELADDPTRRDVSWLALDCLAQLGEFQQLVAMINDADERLAWPDHISRLRAAVVRDPATAAGVRSEMERQHGAQGADLYEMLWGYGPLELDKDQAERLIGYLQHETLAFRVLGFTTLNEITGFGLSYHPEESAADRQRSIQRWKDRCQDGFKPKAK